MKVFFELVLIGNNEEKVEYFKELVDSNKTLENCRACWMRHSSFFKSLMAWCVVDVGYQAPVMVYMYVDTVP